MHQDLPPPQTRYACTKCKAKLPLDRFSTRQAHKVKADARQCRDCILLALDRAGQSVPQGRSRELQGLLRRMSLKIKPASAKHQRALDAVCDRLLRELLAEAAPILESPGGPPYSFLPLSPPEHVRHRFIRSGLTASRRAGQLPPAGTVGSLDDGAAMLSPGRRKRQQHRKTCRIRGTFHGTPLGNLRSIAEQGLLVGGTGGGNMSNGAAMGRGIYSTDVLQTALSYAQRYWLGTIMPCIILCAVVDDTGRGMTPLTQRHTSVGGSVFVSSRCDAVLPLGAIVYDSALPLHLPDAPYAKSHLRCKLEEAREIKSFSTYPHGGAAVEPQAAAGAASAR